MAPLTRIVDALDAHAGRNAALAAHHEHQVDVHSQSASEAVGEVTKARVQAGKLAGLVG